MANILRPCVWLVLTTAAFGQIPAGYSGKPFADVTHRDRPAAIPGRIQAALYDLGGEGVAYHDTDAINHGSGELNYKPGHCEKGVPVYICHFRESEGGDISYVKKPADLNHPNPFVPEWTTLHRVGRGCRVG